jgi:hypothetical protein
MRYHPQTSYSGGQMRLPGAGSKLSGRIAGPAFGAT